MAGVRLASGTSAVWFGAVDASAASGTADRGTGNLLHPPWWSPWRAARRPAGTRAGSVKVTPLHEYPGKGRATGGVRCHRFLKGEDLLVLAWAGPARRPARPRRARRSSCLPRSGSGTARVSG